MAVDWSGRGYGRGQAAKTNTGAGPGRQRRARRRSGPVIRSRALALEGVHVHDYGKSRRPGRKLGHLTFVGRSGVARDRMAKQLLRLARG